MKLKMQRRIAKWRKPKATICPNCGQPGPHFVPPSMGEQGFFICQNPSGARPHLTRGAS